MANEAGMEGIPERKLICDRCKKEIDTSFMDKYDIKGSSFVRVYGDDHSKINSYNEDLELDESFSEQIADMIMLNYSLVNINLKDRSDDYDLIPFYAMS